MWQRWGFLAHSAGKRDENSAPRCYSFDSARSLRMHGIAIAGDNPLLSRVIENIQLPVDCLAGIGSLRLVQQGALFYNALISRQPPRDRYLGVRRRTPRPIRCDLRKNELLKDTRERRLTKSD